MSDKIELTLCEDCALIFGAGFDFGDLGHEDHAHRSGGETWGEYRDRVESWEAAGTIVLVDADGEETGAFTCTLCDDVTYGRMFAAEAEVIAG